MKRSKHSLSHYKLLSMDMGELVPLTWFEVLPGDSIQQATTALIRCSPLVAPVMHPVHAHIRHFFVPTRLIWDEFEDFITGGPDGNNVSVPPYFAVAGTVNVGGLYDYMGVPTGTVNANVSALPFRAYNAVWNEYYRDQDLQTERVINKASGSDGTTTNSLAFVNWEKDYFTSARPWEQKGPAITVPIGTSAPVRGDGTDLKIYGATAGAGDPRSVQYENASVKLRPSGAGWGADQNVRIPQTGATGMFADLTGASAVTVNALREAMALQRYEEARARFGSRYTEYLRYLGVRSSDARLQRPEYLGGGRQTIQFSEVLQTAEGTDPVGDLKGHGIGVTRSNRYRRFFEEHGIIISLMSVRPKTIYSQGLRKAFIRATKEDYWQKELEHIGQAEVYNKEIYAAGASPNGVFGFQDRYDEYRRIESSIAGEFRTVLKYWHFAREFASAPALNAAFVASNPREDPFAAPAQDVLYVMAHHSIQARRMVSKTGSSFIF